MTHPQTLHCVREDIALGLEAVLEDVVGGLCREWLAFNGDADELSYFDAVRDAVTEIRDAVNDSGEAVLALRDESRWTKESRRCYALGKELELAKRKLRETRARLAFTEQLEHQQFKEKRAALALLSEIRELLAEGGEQ
tara:strand:- start:248 stop:664 length:417 start_codon:yes stop_codon:yes gene_type:complete